jgi:hypothetical protein
MGYCNSHPDVQDFLAARAAREWRLREAVPGEHRFVVFRIGLDVCAKCKKPRKEHPKS